MSTAIFDLDETELKAMADRYSTLDLHVLKHCPMCSVRICPSDDLCADCERQAKDSEAWKEYCWNEWRVKV